MLIKTFIIYI